MKFDLDNLKFWEEKRDLKFYKILAVIGTLAVVATGAYFIYKFFTPDYLEDIEDDDSFEFEDEE